MFFVILHCYDIFKLQCCFLREVISIARASELCKTGHEAGKGEWVSEGKQPQLWAAIAMNEPGESEVLQLSQTSL